MRRKKPHKLSLPQGEIEVKWATNHQATTLGQMPFFIEFLHMTGLFEQWLSDCPLNYSSPNAPQTIDVLGTWMLSILSGHKRYAHVTNIRSDGVNPDLLGMSKVISEDSLRRALKKMSETETTDNWMKNNLQHGVTDLLGNPWILDTDTTVKPIYGKQECAVVAYNPTKKGRPSHCYHTYLVAGQRLVLGVEMMAGNETSSKHDIVPLQTLLDGLEAHKRPQLIRGDNAFGNAPVMSMLEERNQAYLFKLKQTSNVKKLIKRVFSSNEWQAIPQTSWEHTEDQLQLSTWSKSRRVVIFRRQVKEELVATQCNKGQQVFGFMEDSNSDIKVYEYTVLVTNSGFQPEELFQLYRDRADAENAFDELKNHWGWGGFTTQDMGRCQLSAQAVALIYNWWTLFVRLANPKKHKEAITSKPLLLQAVGVQSRYKNQRRVKISPRYTPIEIRRLHGWNLSPCV